jgi:two-component system probable response regulator PhcQ
MQSFYDYKKFAILYVDDEERSLKGFIRAFAEDFRILTAANAQDGFKLLEENKDGIGVLMTDQRMPGEKGVQLLERARQLRPRMIRILVTAYSDVQAAIDAVNTGAIYKYISKPWNVGELAATLRHGLEFFIVQRERDHLLKEKMSVLHNIMITDRVVAWGILAAGLGQYLRHPQAAVRALLDLAPAKMPQENLSWEELRNPNYWREVYAHVQTQLKHVTTMLADLGVPTEKPAPRFHDSVALGAAVAQALDELESRRAEKQIRVLNEIPANLPALAADRRQFDRLCRLLLKTEINSLPSGSQITLRAGVTATGQTPGPGLQWEIQDTGSGLAGQSLRSLFDPFFIQGENFQEYATELLACYFIVYHHGGSFVMTNEEGQGTTIRLTFPNLPPETASPTEADILSEVLLNETLWERLLAQG